MAGSGRLEPEDVADRFFVVIFSRVAYSQAIEMSLSRCLSVGELSHAGKDCPGFFAGLTVNLF